MPGKLTGKESEALRDAFNTGWGGPTAKETDQALRALSPHVSRAARRLEQKHAERRSLWLQALALAGCSAAFAALAWLGYQFRAFLLAKPERWGLLLGLGVVSLVVVGCLPILLNREERMKLNEK